MANVTRPEERSSIIGLITTIAGLSSIIAPYAGSQLWVTFEPRIPFLISIVISALVVLPLFVVRETPLENA
jgi:MFS family permease